MGKRTKWEYFRAIYQRYQKASLSMKTQILEEFCHVCGYNRKYAITKLNGPTPQFKPPAKHQRRSLTYSSQALSILQAVWEASGYPWSVRLKAVLPLWLPWVKKHYSLTPKIEHQLLSISARQIDRRLKMRKTQLQRRLYGRTCLATGDGRGNHADPRLISPRILSAPPYGVRAPGPEFPLGSPSHPSEPAGFDRSPRRPSTCRREIPLANR